MLPPAKTIVTVAWVVIGCVWLVGALMTKRTARSQSLGSRVLHTVIAALAVFIGFTHRLQLDGLDRTFVPNTPLTAYAGIILTLTGIIFAIWARFYLGGNWSGVITVKENHTLVTRGPYSIVRHPIYSGFLLGVFGTVLVWREVRGLVGVALVLLLLLMKTRLEEKFMIQEFGAQYTEYRRRVKALIPFVY